MALHGQEIFFTFIQGDFFPSIRFPSTFLTFSLLIVLVDLVVVVIVVVVVVVVVDCVVVCV